MISFNLFSSKLNKDIDIQHHVKSLLDSKTDDAAFKSAHDAISKNKSLTHDHINQIAHSYTGGRQKWPTRKAGLDAIEHKFNERAYQESKMKIVEKLKLGGE